MGVLAYFRGLRRLIVETRIYWEYSKMRLTAEKCAIRTVSAAEVEDLVTAQVLNLLEKLEVVANAIAAASLSGEVQDLQVIKALKDVHRVWEELFPAEQVRITHLLIKQVIITSEGLDVCIYGDGLNTLAAEIVEAA